MKSETSRIHSQSETGNERKREEGTYRYLRYLTLSGKTATEILLTELD